VGAGKHRRGKHGGTHTQEVLTSVVDKGRDTEAVPSRPFFFQIVLAKIRDQSRPFKSLANFLRPPRKPSSASRRSRDDISRSVEARGGREGEFLFFLAKERMASSSSSSERNLFPFSQNETSPKSFLPRSRAREKGGVDSCSRVRGKRERRKKAL